MLGAKPKKQTLTIQPLGVVHLNKSKRAKRLSITVKADQTVKLTIPKRTSLRSAKNFLLSKIPWATKHIQRLKEIEKMHGCEQQPPIDRSKAKAILWERLDYLSHKHGFQYNRLFVRNQKTRWGSCSSLNNINLNMNLINLSQELQDYVILHELVHTTVKNHSKQFWVELDRYVGDAKGYNKKLRKHRLGMIEK